MLAVNENGRFADVWRWRQACKGWCEARQQGRTRGRKGSHEAARKQGRTRGCKEGHNLPPLDQCTGLQRINRHAVNTWLQGAGLSVRAARFTPIAVLSTPGLVNDTLSGYAGV